MRIYKFILYGLRLHRKYHKIVVSCFDVVYSLRKGFITLLMFQNKLIQESHNLHESVAHFLLCDTIAVQHKDAFLTQQQLL